MEEKKARILSIAENIFSRYGIQKTTMDEIAKAARMGKATLYYYFKSKEDIFAAVIHREATILKQKLSKAIHEATTPQDKLSSYISTRMKHLKELGNYHTTLTDEYLLHYSFVEKEREEFTIYEITTIKSILDFGVEEKIFSIEDTGLTARMVTIALRGLEYPLLFNLTEYDLDSDIQSMMQIFFKGIETR